MPNTERPQVGTPTEVGNTAAWLLSEARALRMSTCVANGPSAMQV